MAIIDAKLMLSEAQAITADAASEDILDFERAQSPGIGGGSQVRVVVVVEDAFTSASGDNTLQIKVVDDTAAPVDASSTVIVESEAIPKASLVSGFRKELVVPAEDHGRIMGIFYEVGGTGNFTAGSVNAWIEAL